MPVYQVLKVDAEFRTLLNEWGVELLGAFRDVKRALEDAARRCLSDAFGSHDRPLTDSDLDEGSELPWDAQVMYSECAEFPIYGGAPFDTTNERHVAAAARHIAEKLDLGQMSHDPYGFVFSGICNLGDVT